MYRVTYTTKDATVHKHRIHQMHFSTEQGELIPDKHVIILDCCHK